MGKKTTKRNKFIPLQIQSKYFPYINYSIMPLGNIVTTYMFSDFGFLNLASRG